MILLIGATVMSTLLDLFRVAFFDQRADMPLFFVMMIFQVIILFNMVARLLK